MVSDLPTWQSFFYTLWYIMCYFHTNLSASYMSKFWSPYIFFQDLNQKIELDLEQKHNVENFDQWDWNFGHLFVLFCAPFFRKNVLNMLFYPFSAKDKLPRFWPWKLQNYKKKSELKRFSWFSAKWKCRKYPKKWK